MTDWQVRYFAELLRRAPPSEVADAVGDLADVTIAIHTGKAPPRRRRKPAGA